MPGPVISGSALWVLHGMTLCLVIRSTTVLAQVQDCLHQCPDLQSTFSSTVQAYTNYNCTDGRVTLEAQVVCRQGFRETGGEFTTLCTCDEELCKWTPKGTCSIEIFGVIMAVIAMIFILSIFFLLLCFLMQRKRKGWKKAMYDISQDGSIIDGHNEPEASIGMADISPSSPRIIPIEDLDEVASDKSSSTRVEVHYENSGLEARQLSSGGSGMLPVGLQAGTSTERLIDEEDGSSPCYSNVGPPPLDPGLDSPHEGAVIIRAVPAPASPSAVVVGVADSEPVYAKIDRSKRARDPSRPRGRRAGIDDLLSRIDGEGPLSSPPAPGEAAENLYAEVDVEKGSEAVARPPPVSAKPSRRDREVRRYMPSSSQLQNPATPVATEPPSPPPPPADSVDGLYAQINRHRESLKEHAARQTEQESPGSADEGFVEQAVARV